MKPIKLHAADGYYPAQLRERLGGNTPPEVSTLGNLDLLSLPRQRKPSPELTGLLFAMWTRCVKKRFLNPAGSYLVGFTMILPAAGGR